MGVLFRVYSQQIAAVFVFIFKKEKMASLFSIWLPRFKFMCPTRRTGRKESDRGGAASTGWDEQETAGRRRRKKKEIWEFPLEKV